MASLAQRIIDLANAVGADIKILLGSVLPAGGAAGQVLAKVNSTNYNVGWVTPSSGGGGGALESVSNTLLSNIALATTNAQVPVLSVDLTAGTWLITAHLTFTRTATTAGNLSMMLSPDATVANALASSTIYHASVANIYIEPSISAIVTLDSADTIYLYASHSAGATSNIVRAQNIINAPNATRLNAVKVA